VAFRDIIDVARPALRHRIMPSFEAEADGVSTDDVIERLIEHVPREGQG
jgi:MoxR-like ATPase